MSHKHKCPTHSTTNTNGPHIQMSQCRTSTDGPHTQQQVQMAHTFNNKYKWTTYSIWNLLPCCGNLEFGWIRRVQKETAVLFSCYVETLDVGQLLSIVVNRFDMLLQFSFVSTPNCWIYRSPDFHLVVFARVVFCKPLGPGCHDFHFVARWSLWVCDAILTHFLPNLIKHRFLQSFWHFLHVVVKEISVADMVHVLNEIGRATLGMLEDIIGNECPSKACIIDWDFNWDKFWLPKAAIWLRVYTNI